MFKILMFASHVLFIAVSMPVNAGNTSHEIIKSSGYLSRMSDEFNKTLPKRIDKHIELITTMGEYSTYIIFYRTVNITAIEAKDINLIEGIRAPTKEFSCNNPVFNKLLQAGVLISARYVDRNYKNIGIINITKESCSP